VRAKGEEAYNGAMRKIAVLIQCLVVQCLIVLCLVVLCLAACGLSAGAQNQSPNPPRGDSQSPDPMKLLGHLAGSWVLQGTIAGKQTTHDVEARWILRHEYLEIHETSREKEASGEPAYEAIVLAGWDQNANQYACLWLDSTTGGALASKTTCRATPSGDAIPFLFTLSPTESIHTVFTYHAVADTWQWTIDVEENGTTDRFADVELSRRK
jgi:hypothetical protein